MPSRHVHVPPPPFPNATPRPGPLRQQGGFWPSLLAVVLAIVAAGLGVTAWWLQQQVERERAAASEERQRGEALTSLLLTSFVDDLSSLGRVDLLEIPARKVLDYYASLPADGASSDQSLKVRGAALDLLGEALTRRGDLPHALDAYREALELAEELARRDPSNHEQQRDWAISLAKWGDALEVRADLAGSRAAYDKAMGLLDGLARATPEDREIRHDQALIHERLARVLSAQGDFAAALKASRMRQITLLQLTSEAADNLTWQRELGHSYGAMGDLFLAHGDRPAANAAYQRYQEIAQQVASRQPENVEWQRDLAISYEKAGDLRAIQGDIGGARSAYQKFADIAARLAAQDPANQQWQRDVAAGQERSAAVLAAQAKHREAAMLQQRAADVLAAIATKLGTSSSRAEAAEAYGRLSGYYLLARDPKEAVTAAQRGLALDDAQARLRLNLAHALLYSGRIADAERVYRANRKAALPGEKRFDEEALAELRDFIVKGLIPPETLPVEKWLKGS